METTFLDRMTEENIEDLKMDFYTIQNGRCFACHEPLQLDVDGSRFVYIRPLEEGGSDDTQNLALIHKNCHL